jgi:hypothetical protein
MQYGGVSVQCGSMVSTVYGQYSMVEFSMVEYSMVEYSLMRSCIPPAVCRLGALSDACLDASTHVQTHI